MATVNPFRGFLDTVSETNRIRENWMTGSGGSGGGQRERGQVDAWIPEVDVLLEDSDLVIVADLPGVRSEEVDLSLSGGTLTISGVKRGRGDGYEYYTRERRAGAFRRSMSLPENIDRGRIRSTFGDGVLQIVVEDYAANPEPYRLQIHDA